MDDVSVVLCGEAGQGIQTVENLLSPILNLAGYNVFSSKEYMSRIRGGSNSTEIRVSARRVRAYVERIDILIPLDKDALPHLKERIGKETLILGEKEKLAPGYDITDMPFSSIAAEIGGPIYANIVAVGLVCGLFDVDEGLASEFIRRYFGKRHADTLEKNIAALHRGYGLGLGIPQKARFRLEKDPKISDELMVKGSDAVALGALAGGCDFVAAYPMTPSTGVFTFLAQHAKELEIVVEQAEDEIAAVNMALGAWYAGARGFVTTSGGGFALMVEGLSLAGALESPIVILLSQRPGPATGLPTRTEQADLEFALYSGHGEFPRIILSPGTVEDAFSMTEKAFQLADKHQSPVIILTDQHLVDSYHNIPKMEPGSPGIQRHIVETDADYMRYKVTESGLSPRGIPGSGKGLVKVDSDEHDEVGHITEDAHVRTAMVDKRNRKMKAIMEEIEPPILVGPKRYGTLIVCWGSTYPAVVEAVETLGRKDLSVLYFPQVYPLHPMTPDYLSRAKKTVIVENNAASQFGRLIKLHTGHEIAHKILKYDGLPFSVESLSARLKEVV